MSTLSDLLNSDDETIKESARILNEANEGYKFGKLTNKEYTDIVSTITDDLDAIIHQTANIRQKQAAIDAFNTITEIIKTVMSL